MENDDLRAKAHECPKHVLDHDYRQLIALMDVAQ
jgi:hypothetical protein